MYMPEGLLSTFSKDEMCEIDLGCSQEHLTATILDELPPLLFTPASPGTRRGRDFDMAINRGYTRPRAFSHSPQPTHARRPDARHRNSDTQSITHTPTFYHGMTDAYASEPSNAVNFNAIDAFMAIPSLGSHMHQAQYAASETSASTPEAATFGFNLTPPAAFSTHSSPGYFTHDLPRTMEIPRPGSDYGRPPSSQYLGHHHTYSDGAHPAGMPVVDTFPAPTWDTQPQPTFPYMARGNAPTPSPAHMFNAFGRYPATGTSRRVPEMFKLATQPKSGKQKQVMACLFCRARKIGCVRPPPEEPDQTCNQCARRERECEYPTESRRGQHNRNRSQFIARNGPPSREVPSPSSSLADDSEPRP